MEESYNIHLPFWFSGNPNIKLPICAVGYEEIPIIIESYERKQQRKIKRMIELIDKIRPIFVEAKIIPLQRIIKKWLYSNILFVLKQRKSMQWND